MDENFRLILVRLQAMPAFLDGDYSRFPEAIRQTSTYIAGETCEV